MRSFVRSQILAACALAIVATACGGGDNNNTSPTPQGVDAAYSQVDLRVGTGAEATTGRRVTVNYTGWLYSATAPENKGLQIDSSAGRGPYPFTIGANDVIAGWNQGVAGMRVGGLRRLVIPSSLAYGAMGRAPVVPPNQALVFDIELLTVS